MSECREVNNQMQKNNLSDEELEALRSWLTGYDLSSLNRSKKWQRDFSDAVLLAEILKLEFPTLVEIHNYSRCSGVQSKIDNWSMLNKRVLRKLQIHLRCDEIEKLAKADSFFIEVFLFTIMNQIASVKCDNQDDKELSPRGCASTSVVHRNFDQAGGDQEQTHEAKVNIADNNVADEIRVRDGEVDKLRNAIRKLENEISVKSRQIEKLKVSLEESEKSQKSLFSLGSIRNSLNKIF